MSTIQWRRGTAASATANNPTLAAGEAGYETNTGQWKIGDGVTPWNDLPYQPTPDDVAGLLADMADKVDAADLDTLVASDTADDASATAGALGDAITSDTHPLGVAAKASYGRRDWIDLRDWTDLDLTGTNDNLAVLNAAVAQASDGDTLVIPSGLIALSGAWQIDKSVNIEGTASFDEWPTRLYGFDRPTQDPFMRGAVLLQTASAANGITLTGAAQSTHIRNLGVRFLNRFENTGHGIESAPPAYTTAQDHGLCGALWDNVRVYGHDGDHYAFKLTNPLLNTFRQLRSYGGGAMHLRNNSDTGNYGNSVIDHLYGTLVDGGTAHGIYLQAVSGNMNLLTFIRPQINVAQGETPATMPAPPQKFVEVGSNVFRHNWIGPDFEGATSGMDTNFGSETRWIDPTGIYGSTANKIFKVAQSSAGGQRALWSDMTFGGYSSQALSNKFNGAALGSGAPAVAEVVASDDWRGYLSFGSGSTPTTGVVVDIRYNKNRGQGNPLVFITPANAATAALGLYVAQQTALGFTVGCTTAPAASQPAGTYAFTYRTER